jgi:hypothetical protein
MSRLRSLIVTAGLTAALTATIAAALVACSEATDGLDPGGPLVASPTDAQEGGGESASSDGEAQDGGASLARDATTMTRSAIVINEISGSGEWIELVNAGASAVDLAGWKVADREKDTGGPKLAEAVTFDPGTVLSPRAYVVVKGGGLDAGKPCPEGPQSYCVLAEFGISSKNGETVFLLWPDGGIAGEAVLPPSDGGKDTTYSRVPSGVPDAGFTTRPASPGAKNPD